MLNTPEELVRAHTLLWSHPRVTGPFASSEIEPDDQAPIPPQVRFTDSGIEWTPFGVALLEDGKRIAVSTFLSLDRAPVLEFGLPQAALDNAYGDSYDRFSDPPWLAIATSYLRDINVWLEERVEVRSWAIAEEIAANIALGDYSP